MFEVNKIPEKVKPVFDNFRYEFTDLGYESFTQFASAVINAEKRSTVERLYESILGRKSCTAYGYFFNHVK